MEGSGDRKRVAIIGAGASGLTAIKCVREEGLVPVCFERSDDIGGLWNYSPSTKEDGQASCTKSTIINTSKERMCFSDFPIPEEYPNFMHNTKVLEYFRMYAKEFNLLSHIKFNTEILRVEQTEDFEKTGRWRLSIRDRLAGEDREEIFDAVLVCTGHHGSKHLPKFPGADEFQGQQLHTVNFKDTRGFEDKRVVVIGIGNSGSDAAVELAKVTKQVFLSTRRGSWVLHRVFDRGVPLDMALNRFTEGYILKVLPPVFWNTWAESKANRRFDHVAYGLKPAHRVNAQHPTVNDDLPNRIISGEIQIRPNVKRLTSTGVEFDDGTFEDNIDAVLYATGYVFGFPFIDEEIIRVKKNHVRLFKMMFPPELQPCTLAVIGFFQPLGALMPISELQCRWAAAVFKGSSSLPPRGKMWEDIIAKEDAMRARYVQTQRHTIQVDWLPYLDELAEQVGCKPNLKELFMTDPQLAWQVLFGPVTPFQYRLQGPHAWTGARHHVMTTWERVYAPLRTRHVPQDKGTSVLKIIFGLIVLYILFFWIF